MNAPQSPADTRRYDVVMFDMDGTLVDSKTAIVRSYHDASEKVMGERFPVDPEDVERIIQLRGQEAFPIVAKGDEEKAELIKLEFGTAYLEHQREVPLFDGVEEMLGALREAGVPLGIATSKARERLDEDLRRTGIAHFFDLTVTGDEVPHGKPHPAPILAGIEHFGIRPDRLLYIGDGPNDVIAAREAGADQAGVEFGFHPEECRAEKPTYMLASYSELAPIVLSR